MKSLEGKEESDSDRGWWKYALVAAAVGAVLLAMFLVPGVFEQRHMPEKLVFNSSERIRDVSMENGIVAWVGGGYVKYHDIWRNETREINIKNLVQDVETSRKRLILWESTRDGYSLLEYELPAKAKQREIPPDYSDKSMPAIQGKNLVWVDGRNYNNSENSDIYYYNFETDEEQRITDEPAARRNPGISGDNIVWAEYTGPQNRLFFGRGWRIVLYSRSSDERTTIADNASLPSSLQLNDRKVMWIEKERAFMSFDISKKSSEEIARNVSEFSLSGSRAIYIQADNDIKIRNLQSDEERKVELAPDRRVRFLESSGEYMALGTYPLVRRTGNDTVREGNFSIVVKNVELDGNG